MLKSLTSLNSYVINRQFRSAGKSRAPFIDCTPTMIEIDPVIPRASYYLELLAPVYPVPYLHCHVRGLDGPSGPAVGQLPVRGNVTGVF